MKLIPLVALFFFISSYARAQTKAKGIDLVKVQQAQDRKINIEFTLPLEKENVLVMLSDSAGTTLFLDNQYKFKGLYKSDVDLKKQAKGNYFLEIVADTERFTKKITIK